jgi:uncharacterized protein
MDKVSISFSQKEIEEFCTRWKVMEFSFFGSVVREDFNEKSDLDVLVTFASETKVGLFEMAQMKIELGRIFHRQVDLVEKAGLRNPYRRQEIVRTARVVYAA